MVITPSTDVILLKCPLELDEKNQINFSNATAQYDYFYSLPKFVAGTDFTYQRKDGTIRVEEKFDNLLQYNYVMYRNDAYSRKWFYAFIDDIAYVNDDVTSISIRTDVFQTWQFDLTYKRCFVEREHTNDDAIGVNTVPENVELGEFQIVDQRNIPMYEGSGGWIPCFCVTALPEGCSGAVDGRVKGDNGYIGGVFNCLKFFTVNTYTAAKEIIHAYETGSVTSDAIINIYMIPAVCAALDYSNPTTYNGHGLYPIYNYMTTADENTYLVEPNVMAGSYRPTNNKLYTAPYSYIYMSNNAGEDLTLNWEDFPLSNGRCDIIFIIIHARPSV